MQDLFQLEYAKTGRLMQKRGIGLPQKNKFLNCENHMQSGAVLAKFMHRG